MFTLTIGMALAVVILAMGAEYIDSTLGMGYGTSLTPILLILGFSPLQIVPVILMSECITGIFAGLLHNSFGNADFYIKTKNPTRIIKSIKKYGIVNAFKNGISENLRTVLLFSVCGLLGTTSAIKIAVNLSKFYLSLFIAIMVLLIGIYILLTYNKVYKFSWKKLSIISIIAAFNKGISGGGYGPIVTSGQVVSGVEGKNAIAITSLAEGITCLFGVLAYFISGAKLDFTLAPYLIIGGILSVPFAAFTLKKIDTKKIRISIGVLTIILGIVTLLKLFIK